MKQTLLSILMLARAATSCTKDAASPSTPFPDPTYNLSFILDGKDGSLVGVSKGNTLAVHITFQDSNHGEGTVVLKVTRRAGGEDLYSVHIPATTGNYDTLFNHIEHVKNLSIYSVTE